MDLASKYCYILINISLERIEACSLILEMHRKLPERNRTKYAVYDIGQILLTLEALHIYTTFTNSFRGLMFN